MIGVYESIEDFKHTLLLGAYVDYTNKNMLLSYKAHEEINKADLGVFPVEESSFRYLYWTRQAINGFKKLQEAILAEFGGNKLNKLIQEIVQFENELENYVDKDTANQDKRYICPQHQELSCGTDLHYFIGYKEIYFAEIWNETDIKKRLEVHEESEELRKKLYKQ